MASNQLSVPSHADIISALRQVIERYHQRLGVDHRAHIPRTGFHVRLALEGLGKPLTGLSVCDIGAGTTFFAVACAALGAGPVFLVDDFGDGLSDYDRSVLEIHREYGVQIVERDVLTTDLTDLGPLDVVTSFASMEHWNRSPKRLFQSVVSQLRDGGTFILGTPNCVNLRKRITVPLGVGSWTPLEDWYEPDVFRGHVREPDVKDLRTIMLSLGLRNINVYGRNWLGYDSRYAFARVGTRLLDYPLRLRPSLCSDIYVVGRKLEHAN